MSGSAGMGFTPHVISIAVGEVCHPFLRFVFRLVVLLKKKPIDGVLLYYLIDFTPDTLLIKKAAIDNLNLC